MGQPLTAAVRFLSGEREPVRVATTGNIVLSGLQTVDGVALSVGDRVLVKDQADATENGILLASEGGWFRASDAGHTRAINEGITVQVREGTVNNDREYRFTSLDPVIGADPITLEWSDTQAAQAAAEAAADRSEEAADRAEAAADEARDDFLASVNPLLAVKLQTVAVDGQLEYDLLTPVPAVLGHLHLDVTIGWGAKQPKDGVAYTVIDGGTKIRFSEQPDVGAALYAEGAVTIGVGTSLDNGILNVTEFGATTSILQLPSVRRDLLQTAIDAAALVGSTCLIPAGTWLVDSDLFYRSNSRIAGAGSGITIVKLSDTADKECSVFSTEDTVGTRVYNVRMQGITGDANGDRSTVTSLPVNRPAGSGFVIANVDGFIGEDLEGVDAVLHGIDVTNGGYMDGGHKEYGDAAGPLVYPANHSKNIFLIGCKGLRNGDDGITTHYSQDIYITDCVTGDNIKRFSSSAAPGGVEIDDGSRRVWLIRPQARNCNVGIAAKRHEGTLSPFDIHIISPISENCTVGVGIVNDRTNTLADLDANQPVRNVHLHDVRIVNPKRFPGTTNGMVGIRAAGVDGLYIYGFSAIASGAETEALDEGILMTAGVKNAHVFGYHIENWPRSVDAVPAVRLGSQVEATIYDGNLVNCGGPYGVVCSNQAGRRNVIGLKGVGISGAGQALLRLDGNPASGTSVGAIRDIDETSPNYAAIMDIVGVTSAAPTNISRGNSLFFGGLQVNGMFNVGVAVAKTIASDTITVGDSSYVQLDTQGGASTDNLATINGGQEGDMLFLRIANSDRDVVVKNGTGNITLDFGADMTLGSVNDTLTLICRSSGGWTELGRRVSA